MFRLAVTALACLWVAEVSELRSSQAPAVRGSGAAQANRTTTASEQNRWTVALPRERVLRVHVTVGDVRVHGEAREDAQIEVVRTAPTADALARFPIRVDQTDSGVSVVALQADDGTDPRLRSDVTLRVPRAAALGAVRIGEGRLTLQALSGSVDADVRRGSIEATDVEGTLRLETGIGDVVVSRARLRGDGLLRLRTFNGDVRLTFDRPPADARVLALALNGTIESDIPLRMKDTWGPRFGETTLGTGEPVVSIDVVTGRVVIRTQR